MSLVMKAAVSITVHSHYSGVPMKHAIAILLALVVFGVGIVPAQGKFSGYMFGDYFYNVARDTSFRSGGQKSAAVGGQKDLQAFQLRRVYFTYDNDISDKFTSRFRLEADGSALTSNSKITTFVKDAYLKWKNIFAGSDLTFGLQPTSAYEISENAWGYRSIEKTIMDLRGIVPSRELGISLRGKLAENLANYWVTLSNNSTSSSVVNGTVADNDKFKRYSLHVQVMPTKELQFTVYGSLLARRSIDDPKSTTNPPATVGNNTTNLALFVGYNQKNTFNVGVEGFLSSTANGIPNSDTTGLAAANALGFTLFGTANLTPDLVVIGRYDYFDPNTDSRYKGDLRNYVIAGVAYKADKNVQIIPNVQYESYQSLPKGGRSVDASVTARVTFYYVFL
jgi:hypothetical protein